MSETQNGSESGPPDHVGTNSDSQAHNSAVVEATHTNTFEGVASNGTEKYEGCDKVAKGVASQKEEVKDFDDMLHRVGSWGRFQIALTCFFFPFNLFLGYVYLSPILINFTPPHWCKIGRLGNLSLAARKHLTLPLEDNVQSQCYMYDTDWSEVLSSGREDPDPDWPKVPCTNGWEYDIENFHSTVVTDFDWVCQDAWIPAMSQGIFFLGAIPGTIGFGYFSDNYGRVPATLITNIIAMVCGLVTPLASGPISFFILRMLMGLTFNTLYTQPYILSLEYVDENKRTLVGNLGLALFLTLSGVYQPWLIKYLGDWKSFSWIIYGQMIIVLAVPWIIPESSRWLMSQGKSEKAVKIMRKIAKINKKEVSEDIYESFRLLCEKERERAEHTGGVSFLDLFRHKNLRKITLLTIVLWMITSLVFDSSVRNVENLDVSIYISFMISTGLELPADLLSIVGLEYLGRRWSAALSLGLSGLFMLLTVPALGNVYAAAFFSMAGRFFATYAMNTGFQFTVEVMPTELRGQGTGIANIMSMVAQIASPYIVFSGRQNQTLPFIIIGLVGLLGFIPGLFLPETQGCNLPDTIEETHSYGKRDRFFWMPFMGKEKRYKEKSKDGEIVAATNPAYKME